ncbi:sensor histidine kinase [uncultured Olleya sp.]|uniref:sensor histidine kinase n=1 Tax=uncultured Olleya sp. TaxID=757243 RepID=UPI002593D2F1|nr:sensor histidine kinase [uncultured Olleya sp.]
MSKNEGFSNIERIKYAEKAVYLSIKLDVDSTLLNSNKNLSYLYIVNQKFEKLKDINFANINIANKLKDTSSIANANYNLGYAYESIQKIDSAYYYYYNAAKYYDKLKDYKLQAAVLLNMANLQEAERDYIGAQNNVIKAIELVKKLPINAFNLDTQWSLYNTIGIITGELHQYENSIDYHKKAIKSINTTQARLQLSNDAIYYYKTYSNVNIASTYRKKGDYNLAIKNCEQIINDSKLLNEDPVTYAYILNELAYSKFLRGESSDSEIEFLFRQSYSICDSVSDKELKQTVSVNLAEYFASRKVLDSANYYATIGYKLGKELSHNKTILKALVLKSKIETGEASKQYLYEHIKLNDSLILAERANRNKFMRIDFETDEIKQENKQMSRERLWLLITSISLLVVLFFLYILKTQREKNKELQLERQQQEANEEIYNLMLSQQNKIDEAKSLEKNRISKDIHDGILGKLFGVRLSLDGLNISKTDEATKKRGYYISELKNIEEEIRKVSHELNSEFIHQAGFLDIITALVETQMTAYNINYRLDIQDDINWESLNNKIKIHLYRILQETMQNTYKHANATLVNISFKYEKNLLTLTVSDNGSGFDLNKSRKGIGLKNLDSRIEEINGKLKIESKINKGTIITINVIVSSH